MSTIESTTSLRIGDIVWIPFPFVERAEFKSRPALVLTARQIGLGETLIWGAMITSAARPRWAGDIVVDDLPTAGLPGRSVVRTAKIATLVATTGRLIGRLGDRQIEDVVQQIEANLTPPA